MREEKRQFFLWWLPATIYTAFILVMSTQPFPAKLPGSYTDKILHFFAYGVLSALVYFPLRRMRNPGTITIIVAILISVFVGMLDETIQAFNPARTASISDLLADACGALAAVLICRKTAPGRTASYKRGYINETNKSDSS